MTTTAYNPALELRRIAASVRPAPFVHPQDPKRHRGTDRRILCADGHWHRISELQHDLRCEDEVLIHATE